MARDTGKMLSLVKELKGSGSASGKEPEEKGLQEMLEGSLYLTMGEPVNEELEGKLRKNIKKFAGLEAGKRSTTNKAICGAVTWLQECWRTTREGEGTTTIYWLPI